MPVDNKGTMKKRVLVGALMLVATASVAFAIQRGRGGPAGALPSYYTNRSAPLGAVDTSAADKTCSPVKAYARVVCLADLLKTGLSPELLARLQLPYATPTRSGGAICHRWVIAIALG